MRICIDMDTLELVAYHTDPALRDGLAQLQGTRSHHLFFDSTFGATFLSNFTTLELNKFISNVLGADFDTSTLDDDDRRAVIAAYCEALEPPDVSWQELEEQLEVVAEFLELDPDASPRFRYVRGAGVPEIVDETLTID